MSEKDALIVALSQRNKEEAAMLRVLKIWGKRFFPKITRYRHQSLECVHLRFFKGELEYFFDLFFNEQTGTLTREAHGLTPITRIEIEIAKDSYSLQIYDSIGSDSILFRPKSIQYQKSGMRAVKALYPIDYDLDYEEQFTAYFNMLWENNANVEIITRLT